jgi:hypothetical protein
MVLMVGGGSLMKWAIHWESPALTIAAAITGLAGVLWLVGQNLTSFFED